MERSSSFLWPLLRVLYAGIVKKIFPARLHFAPFQYPRIRPPLYQMSQPAASIFSVNEGPAPVRSCTAVFPSSTICALFPPFRAAPS